MASPSSRLRFRLASAATDNATLVRAGDGTVQSIIASNINAALRYLKLYDKATAPTSGDTPIATIALPANGAQTLDLTDLNLPYALGLGVRIVTGATDADATATAANEQFVTITHSA